MKNFFGGVVVLVVCLWVSCSPANESPLSDASYFPVRVGNFIIYQVNETDILQLTCGNGGQTYKQYQLKDLFVDSVKNAEGTYTYTIQRYSRPDSTQPWTDVTQWSARVTPSGVVVADSNISYVRIAFPVRNNVSWNANLYNSLAEVDYKMSATGSPYTLSNGKKFLTTLTVTQGNQTNLVYEDQRFEVYAAGIGLVYRSSTVLNYFTDPACYGLNEVKDGTIYIQSLIQHGHQ